MLPSVIICLIASLTEEEFDPVSNGAKFISSIANMN